MAMDLFSRLYGASQQLDMGAITMQQYLTRVEQSTDGYMAKVKQKLA